MKNVSIPNGLSSISLIGSTSCGKSTIGNLLTGRYILPSGVQETTTSIVEVCHTITPQSTVILSDVNDIDSEYLKHTLTSDMEIRNFINQVMTSADSVTPYALQTRKSRIKRLIAERWKQVPVDSELTIIPLSAGLVLATEMLCWHSDFLRETDYHHFKEYIDNYGISLLPDQITDGLSRQVDEWRYRQWLAIYRATYFLSGFNQLVQALKGRLNIRGSM